MAKPLDIRIIVDLNTNKIFQISDFGYNQVPPQSSHKLLESDQGRIFCCGADLVRFGNVVYKKVGDISALWGERPVRTLQYRIDD